MTGNINLFKQISATTGELAAELADLLGRLDAEVGGPLLQRLSDQPHARPLLVFTGQYSSGKSTLIEALTDRAFQVAVGSGVTTDGVTTYDWDGDVQLVDTPGVHAGRPGHDELAEEALQTADLVLFAVPVELFDDVLVDHLRDVLGRLGKARQTIIVITKADTMEAAPGVRDAAIRQALGSFAPVPWVECDAQNYLYALDTATTDPQTADVYRDASGLADVVKLINRFAAEQGEGGPLRQPLQLIAALAAEASAAFADDPDEQAVLTVLARQRSALSRKRSHLDDLTQARAAQFRAAVAAAAGRLADQVEHLTDMPEQPTPEALQPHIDRLQSDLEAALEQFEASVRRILEVQLDDLSSEVREIEATPYGRIAVQLASPTLEGFQGPPVEVGHVQREGRAAGSLQWVGYLGGHLKKFHQFWEAGDGVKAAAGGRGHQIVLDVGHAFGKKFKPWEAVGVANKIGVVAKVGGGVAMLVVEIGGVVVEERNALKAERARTAHRRAITQEVLGQAESIATEALVAVRRSLDATFNPSLESIDQTESQIRQIHRERADGQQRLDRIQIQAQAALHQLGRRVESLIVV